MVVFTVFAEGVFVFGALAFIPTHLHFARGIDLSIAGLALIAYALGGVTFALFARRILARLGEVKLAIWGTLMLTAGCAVIAGAPNAPWASVGCLIAGVGFYALHNTLQTNATQMAPQTRGAAMALFASFFFLGQSVGVAVAGALVERIGTTAVILGAGLAVIPVGITFARLRRVPPPRARAPNSSRASRACSMWPSSDRFVDRMATTTAGEIHVGSIPEGRRPRPRVAPRSAHSRSPIPSKPVKIIVPFAAGGPADIYARVVGEKLQAALGQSFVIEDRPGGGAIVGTDAVAKSAPDGYTLLMMSNTHTVNESLFAEKPYQLLRDLVPVAPVNYSDLVMVVHPSVPAANLAEFLALAKAKPGELNYASSGPGTPYHMAGELFKAMAGVDIVHVPYKGSSGARTDILGGQVQMMFDAITTMAPNVRAGKLKALGTSGKVRSTGAARRCRRSPRPACPATTR